MSAPPELLASRRSQAELMFHRIGITFNVYGDKESTERLIPFDIAPRAFAHPAQGGVDALVMFRAL